MIVIQMLLPRFLVLEVVLFFHFLQLGQCYKKASLYLQTKTEDLQRKNQMENSDIEGGNINSTSDFKDLKSLNVHRENTRIDANGLNKSPICKINLDKESLKWMPLFYSTGSNSYLMPIKEPDIYVTGNYQPNQTLKRKRKGRKIEENNRDINSVIQQSSRWLTLNEGQTGEFIVSCPGTRIKQTNTINQRLTCVNGNTFEIQQSQATLNAGQNSRKNGLIEFSELSCAKSIKETIQTTKVKCGPVSGNGRLIHIGWPAEYTATTNNKIDSSSFVPQITVCHDYGKEHNYFTNHTLHGPAIDSRDVGKTRGIRFKEGGRKFYASSSAATAYKISSQKQMFAKLLPDANERSKIFMPGEKRGLYLSKGHLSPDADFVWKEWQDASYYFLNAAPQWQAFNNGNWKAVEAAVRKYATEKRVNLKVFTGTEGQLKVGKARVSVSLAKKKGNRDSGDGSTREETKDLIPAPLQFWKLIYNDQDNTGIVFVGLNDPHFSKYDDTKNEASRGEDKINRTLCPNDDPRLCEKASWKFSHRKDVHRGFLYCCTWRGFTEKLPWASKAVDDIQPSNLLVNV